MSDVKLFLLGSPRFERQGTPLTLNRSRGLALLAYLAVTREAHSREALATLLWPESEPSRGRARLRRELVELNQLLGQGYLEAQRDQLGLAGRQVWLDVSAFQELLARCRRHGHPATEVCPDCVPLLAEAVALYRGDFLTGVSLPDSQEFDDWQLFQTEELRHALAGALDRLVQGYSRQSNYEAAIAQARRWLALDPLHEPALRHLMYLYAQAGRPAAALRQYEFCCQTLIDELGLSPELETIKLYEQIRDRQVGPTEGKTHLDEINLASPKPAILVIPRHNLPAQTTAFIGRERELADLGRLMDNQDVRLLTILGPGGMGKTRLALEAARRHLEPSQDRVYFVSLTPLQTAEDMVTAIAEAVGYPFQADKRSPRQQLLDYFQPKQMWVILDNVEHLLAGVDLVNDILQAAPGVKVLATSRERLYLSGETVFALGGMAFRNWETVEEALAQDMVQLFMQGAQRARPDFELVAPDLTALVQICRWVGGMPLGILLAAAWIDLLSPQEIAAEINESFDFLETELRDVPERQRSIRVVFEHTWRRLNDAEQVILMKLAIFQGGFTRQAAQIIAGASLQNLSALVNKSLLHREPSGRYTIHELLRQYAEEKLKAAGQAEAAHDAHTVYYTDFLQERETDLKGQRQKAALDEIENDFENVRVTWQWAAYRRNYAAIRQALESLFWFCEMRVRQQEGQDMLRLARQRLGPTVNEKPHPVWGQIMARVFGRGPIHFAPLAEAKVQINIGLAIAQAEGNQAEIAFCRWQLGRAAFHDDDLEGAIAYYEQSLTHYQSVDDRFSIAQLLRHMGQCHALMGHRNLEIVKQSLSLRREIGDSLGMIHCLTLLAAAAFFDGHFAEAETYQREAYQISYELNDKYNLALSLIQLNEIVSVVKGDFVSAHVSLEQIATIVRDLNNPRLNFEWLHHLGRLLGFFEDYVQCRQLCQQAILIPQQLFVD